MINVGPVLAAGRRAFLARMRGTCTVTRPGAPVTNDDGVVTTPQPVIFEGPCYMRYPGLAFENNHDAQGVTVTQSRVVARLPFGVIFRPGDLVTILSDPDNPQMVGTVLRVASIDDQSQATAQRLLCEDNQAGVT